MSLSRTEKAAIKWAVNEAEGWRGTLIGNYGDEESQLEEKKRLAEFDRTMRHARNALKKLLLDSRIVEAAKKAGKL